jgi:uncharacterized protein (TIGR03435 family)
MDMRATFRVLILAAGALLAQTPESHPSFEAAFIKANATGSGSSSSNGTKGQLVMVNQSLRRMVERAYSVKPFQVVAPDWLDGARFDVTAKYPEGTKDADRPAMLRGLLEERFKLVTHSETKELPAYALTVSKGGLKIKAVESDKNGGTSSNSNNNAVKLQVTAIPMTDVADYLARRLGSAVVDKTGVEGLFSFELHWTMDDPNGGPSGGAAEFAAIQEAIGTLGLHLQSTKTSVQVVVVDHVERVPTEN